MGNRKLIRHYTKYNDYPKPYGIYLNQDSPEIPCIVIGDSAEFLDIMIYRVRDKDWAKESCDSYPLNRDEIESWVYIDDFLSIAE